MAAGSWTVWNDWGDEENRAKARLSIAIYTRCRVSVPPSTQTNFEANSSLAPSIWLLSVICDRGAARRWVPTRIPRCMSTVKPFETSRRAWQWLGGDGCSGNTARPRSLARPHYCLVVVMIEVLQQRPWSPNLLSRTSESCGYDADYRDLHRGAWQWWCRWWWWWRVRCCAASVRKPCRQDRSTSSVVTVPQCCMRVLTKSRSSSLCGSSFRTRAHLE